MTQKGYRASRSGPFEEERSGCFLPHSYELMDKALEAIASALRFGTIPESLAGSLPNHPLLEQILCDLKNLRRLALCIEEGEPVFLSEAKKGNPKTFGPEMQIPLKSVCRRSRRILLAEDDIINQSVALKMLAGLGYQADAVSDGQEVLDVMESVAYDLILMDCQMPLLDGYETSRSIRSLSSKSIDTSIPIIALTANTMPGEREKCLAAGMNDYVTKPVNPLELAQVLDRWLNGSQKCALGLSSEEASAMATVRILDRKVLLERLMGDEELAGEIVAAFIQDIPEKLRQARDTIGRGAAPELQEQAHTLKGTCGTVGAMAMQATAARLEDAARSANLEQAALIVNDMEKGLEDLKADLNMR